jgi:hypothetical protein
MFQKQILFIALAIVPFCAHSQDKIYKRNGETIDAKVKQLSYVDITYKRADNPDGPDHIISKRDVTRIEYENGMKERIMYGRRSRRVTDLEQKRSADYSHNNIISITLLNITQSGTGIGLTYERLLDKKGCFSFYLPVSMLVLGYQKDVNNDIAAPVGWLSDVGRDRGILQVMPGAKFYPTGSRGKVRYAIGAQLMYGAGYIVEQEFPEVPYYLVTAPLHNPYKNLRVAKAGVMINNSLNISTGPHFYFAADLGLGITFINKKEVFSTGEMKQQPANGLAQFSVRLGYRF